MTEKHVSCADVDTYSHQLYAQESYIHTCTTLVYNIGRNINSHSLQLYSQKLINFYNFFLSSNILRYDTNVQYENELHWFSGLKVFRTFTVAH